ncbi:MAG TPA: tetratricopeptide repeat protein [Longimicrobiales bacterium]
MRRSWVLIAIAAFVAFGIGDLERGNRAYREGRYAEAVEAYRAALSDGESSPELHYNLGTALLRLGRYAEAEKHLREALASVEPDTRERTHYNLGSRFLGEARAAADPRARAQLLDAAIEAYRRALRVAPADMDAKWNYELALREKQNTPSPQQGGSGDPRGAPQNRQGPPSGGANAPPRTGGASGDEQAQRDPRGAGTLSREQAARILSAVEQDERELYREKLRKGRRDTPVARDW